jgi:outer membrane protein TolC
VACGGLALGGCATMATLTRPEGDGGWSPTRRQQELAQRAAVSGVVFNPTPVASAEPTPSSPAVLNLAAALALAATHNRRIAEADTFVASAGERVVDVRGRLLPNTTGQGRYTWYTDSLTTSAALPPGLLPGAPATFNIKTRDADFGTVNGTLSLPIDLSGELRHALAAAQASYRGEQARAWATNLEQQTLVVRSYFDLLEALRLREVTQQTLALYRQQLATAQSRFDNGRVTKNQLLVVQVALRNAEQQLLQRDLAIERARWTLNQVIGAAIDAATDIEDVTSNPEVPGIDDALRMSHTSNPALRSLLEEQQRLEETVRSLERSRLPRFAAGGAVDYSSSNIVEPQRVGSGFTGFTWDLGTDWRREAQIADARVAAERNRIVVERTLREIEAAIRSTQLAAQERLAAFATAATAVGQAEENLRIRQQQFEVGRADSEDVLEANALLAQQRAVLATALYQAHTRRAELQQLIGLPLDELVSQSR